MSTSEIDQSLEPYLISQDNRYVSISVIVDLSFIEERFKVNWIVAQEIYYSLTVNEVSLEFVRMERLGNSLEAVNCFEMIHLCCFIFDT